MYWIATFDSSWGYGNFLITKSTKALEVTQSHDRMVAF